MNKSQVVQGGVGQNLIRALCKYLHRLLLELKLKYCTEYEWANELASIHPNSEDSKFKFHPEEKRVSELFVTKET